MGECKRDDMRNMIFNVRLQNIDNGFHFSFKNLEKPSFSYLQFAGFLSHLQYKQCISDLTFFNCTSLLLTAVNVMQVMLNVSRLTF